MSSQTDEVVAEVKSSTSKNMNWGGVGILFSTLIIIICVAAMGFGYFQLSQTTTSLTKTLVGVEAHSANMQRSLDEVRQATEKAQQKSQESIRQEQLVTELYSRLVSLDNLLDQLPLPIPSSSTKLESPDESVAVAPGLSWWRTMLARSWEALRKIVVVRYIGKNELPLITPEEKLFLFQNLHAQIQSAMWATLHHNSFIYQNSLERAKTWIQRYFIQDATETKNVLQEIEELQKMNVSAAVQ